MSLVDCTIYTPSIRTVLSQSSGENLAFAHFAAAITNHHNVVFLILPSTHHCWVGKDSME